MDQIEIDHHRQRFTVITENKMWFSKDVPLSGLVRMDTTVGTTTSKLELIGTGHK
jgi:hypothetical protein